MFRSGSATRRDLQCGQAPQITVPGRGDAGLVEDLDAHALAAVDQRRKTDQLLAAALVISISSGSSPKVHAV